jgi:SAM-dependent methyltransferase
MAALPPNLPSQAAALLSGPSKVTTYESTGGAVTAQFASHNLTLIPSIPPNSTIHDNACGSGTVSRAILSLSPTPTGIKIHATDIDQVFLDALSSDVTKNTWPISVSNQALQKLDFEDNFFTHSISNIGIIFAPESGLTGAQEIHRTLKPGGTAVVNCWRDITYLPAIFRANVATRPGVAFPQPRLSWADGKQLRKIMVEAGFKEESMRMETSEAWAKTTDLRGWAEKAWAYVGGLGGWHEGDEERWDEAVDTVVSVIMQQPGTKKVGEEVWMRTSQWVIVATK